MVKPVIYIAASLIAGASLSYFLLKSADNQTVAETTTPAAVAASPVAHGAYHIERQKGYRFINPLLDVKPEAEAVDFSSLKSGIESMIEKDKSQGAVSTASVYLYSFNLGQWIYINPDESYHPGSLIKVPMLMTWLKDGESDPHLLQKMVTYNAPGRIPEQTFNSMAIQPGKSYSVLDLLHHMIAYSDNNATNLLNQNANVSTFRKVFSDIGLPDPDVTDRQFSISARSYSEFFIVLYNATYLSRGSSEAALALLSECNFKEGMLKDLPATVKVSHKFGEWGDVRMNIHELHESGIVYLDNNPYLLTVMTRGHSVQNLPVEISHISRMVYDQMSSGHAVASAR